MNAVSNQNYTDVIQKFVLQGGPNPTDDQFLSIKLQELYADLHAKRLTTEEVDRIRSLMNLTPDTMQGFAYLKPNGYAGCFEMIDRIYQNYHSSNPQLYNWDRYCQNHPATNAVRNRKQYFIHTVHQALKTRSELSILNVASGPGRDLLELFQSSPDLPVKIHCIEQDERAIQYASNLCQPFLHKITFQQANALRFSVSTQFDLVWSAGLFDYLNDRLFIRLLQRLRKMTKAGGDIVIGNFSPDNPSRAYMELFDWILIHRSSGTLIELAMKAHFAREQIKICSEELGVNLFMHIHHI